MLATAIALIVLGVAFGFFFPVMFVAGAAGGLLLMISIASVVRRATTGSPRVEDPTPDRPE